MVAVPFQVIERIVPYAQNYPLAREATTAVDDRRDRLDGRLRH
jgi:hypothetical protein